MNSNARRVEAGARSPAGGQQPVHPEAQPLQHAAKPAGASPLRATTAAEHAGRPGAAEKRPQGPVSYRVRIRYTCGTYVTNTLMGQRSSSTSDAQTAAQSLAGKLFERMDGAPELVACDDDTSLRQYRITGWLRERFR